MKIKELEEKRAELLKELETENNAETRSVEKIENLLKEVDEVNASISKEKEIEERLLKLNENGGTKVEKELEKRDYNAEIRQAIAEEKEIDVTNFEVEERTHGMGITGPLGQTGVTKNIGNIKKMSFANQILKKASEVSELYKYVRRENLGTALHQIPVQKSKITKFANVKELAEYQQQNIEFDVVQLAAHKYGNISIVSEEAIADLGYDIMGELIEQYGEAAGEKLDELLVKGDNTNQVQGLNSFINSGTGNAADNTDTKVTKIEEAESKAPDTLVAALIEMYNSVGRKYSKNGTWVMSSDMVAILNMATDANGRPLLYNSFNETPFGTNTTPMFLGRPVVITDEVTGVNAAAQHNAIAFFGDLNKALILGVRQNFTLKSSREYMWVRDGVAIKGTMRTDVKRGITEAMAALVRK